MDSLPGLASIEPRVAALIVLVVSGLMLAAIMVLRGRRGSAVMVRSLPTFRDLRNRIQEVAETGGTIHVAAGSGALDSTDCVVSLAALQALEGVADAAVAYGVPLLVTVGDPTLLVVCQDVVRRAYERRGLAGLYDPARIRYVAPTPVAYAAGAGYELSVEGVSVSLLAGVFGAEASLIADSASRRGLPQLAALADPQAIAATYGATEDLAMGEELFAAGAQTSENRPQLVSLLVQDVLRVNLVIVTLIAAALALLSSLGAG
jgi:hypothetical protein